MIKRLVFSTVFLTLSLSAQDLTITARVTFDKADGRKVNAGQAVVWLSPQDSHSNVAPPTSVQSPRLVQHNKTFEPHVLVVPAGSLVAWHRNYQVRAPTGGDFHDACSCDGIGVLAPWRERVGPGA